MTFRILKIPTPLVFSFGIFGCSNTKEDSTIPHVSEFRNPHGNDSLNYSSKETCPIREHIKKNFAENRTKNRKLQIYIFHKYHLVAYSLLHLYHYNSVINYFQRQIEFVMITYLYDKFLFLLHKFNILANIDHLETGVNFLRVSIRRLYYPNKWGHL